MHQATLLGRKNLLAGVGLVWALGLLVALESPDAVLSGSQAAATYVAIVSPLSDPHGVVATRSTYPQVTQLYHGIVVWSLPLWVGLWWQWLNSQVGVSKTGFLFKDEVSWWGRVFLVLASPLWLGIAYLFTLNHGGDTRLVAFGTSRLQLGLFGIAFQLGTGAMAAFFVFCLKRALIK